MSLAAVLWAGDAAADRWYVHYENAEQALADERWSDAVEQIQAALERKGDSGSRVRTYGMRVTDYFPYLKLGIAYQHLGQPAAAREAFDTEERLGAIAESPEGLGELERFRKLASEALAAVEASPRRRAEEALSRSLVEARRLEAAGRFDDAMNALATGLAADPESAEALELMAQLRSRSVTEDEQRRRREERTRRLERAGTLLDRGDAEGAAGLLREIAAPSSATASLRADPEAREQQAAARRMLEEARQVLAASVAKEARREMIASTLEEARSLETAGRLDEALARLERVFAVAPENEAANRLREEWVAAQSREERSVRVSETLAAAAEAFEAGRFENALAAANRVLALERGNGEALDLIRKAYGEISRRVLGGSAIENLPPAIRFADQRREVDGELVEEIRRPELRLTGVVLDRSPVTLEFLDGDGRPVPGSYESQRLGDTVITEFRLAPKLAPGPAVLTLIATDAAGATSRAEYRAVYSRPWFRSPVPWTALAGGLTALGLLVVFRRRRRRRKLLRRRFNPYVAGGPIFDADLFFGREPLVQKILQTVHNNSLLLHGERRIGKTSLLHQLHRRLEALEDPEYRFLPVYVDLQGTPEGAFFATLADQIFDTLDPSSQRPVARDLARSRPGGYTHHDLVRELHGLLKKLRQESSKRVKVVLLIDEVDELNHYDPRVNQSLRSLFMKRFAENLAAVVAGVGIRKEWEKEGSPWYNFFEELEVEAITPEEAQRLVVEPVKEVFRFEAGAAERIVASSGGKPFLIQRCCLVLVGRLHEEGRRTVTLEDVDALEAAGLGSESSLESARENGADAGAKETPGGTSDPPRRRGS